ncbi:hypothetical protein [Actinoplanes derwentensis]|uniref:Uncharacterized protein n=1 Tax=Actinoplanes derwentensis TaxID=113562 RepID=A0A1H2DDR9_9ACTN|nr:hypothetical protein [Actinoplanes derwentensis]GID84873.1 hypothetical protein Ade03nite_37970 [Actinoplanes derwentensis]SDT80895.1 hypothetical protein SAMN04489716_9408 [Actinoplanes derwentensis]
MPRESVKPGRAGGLGLFLLAVPAVVEPAVTALAVAMFPEIADASLLGGAGTIAVGVAAAVLAAVGAALALRGTRGLAASIIAVLLSVAGGLVALVAFSLLFAGGALIIFAILLLHAAFSIAMIVRAVTRSGPEGVAQ